MENQHRKISGYRELSEEEIALMNEIKAKAEEIGAIVSKLERAEPATLEFPGDAPDKRWVAIAKTHLQQGFMALVRSIAKPTTF